MRQTIMLMAACAALLAGCTNEEMNEGLGIDTPIQVAENTEYNLDNFGLYIKDKDDSYTSNYGGENIKASKPEDASAWTLADEVLYQGSGQTYFAYAPYQSIEAGATSVDFTVEANQSADEGKGMQRSDLLYATGSVDEPTLAITLSHKLSKLTVTLTPEGFGPDEVSFTGVTLQGTKLGTTLNLTDGTLGEASGTAADITMCPTGTTGTYECILVPQEATYSVLINAEVGGEQKTYVYTPSAAYTFESDQSYTLALTVRKADEPTAIESIDVKGWGDGNDIALGDGEAVEPYTIDAAGNYTVYTAEGLQAWRKAINSENTINCTLAADIDMTGQTLPRMDVRNFGVFDGNGHTITGLKDCLVHWNEGGTIRNLTLVEPTITTNRTGAVAGTNYGTIENCHVVGGSVVSQGSWCGGIVGANDGTIRACSSSTAVTAYLFEAGGIAGISTGTILACYATGSVTADGVQKGAIAGLNANNYGGIMTACYWSGDEENSVGSGSPEGATKVADGNWATAMTEMNKALQTDGSTYRWKTNGVGETGNRPLVIATE